MRAPRNRDDGQGLGRDDRHGLGSITDVEGIAVGHATRRGRGWRTGTTVVLAPAGAVAGVDVRGGGPGTRETEAIGPLTLVHRIHAVCLSGGSAYGLASAHGVMEWLEEHELGVSVGTAGHEVVPVVPSAVIFDLGRGGNFRARPDPDFGRRAANAASTRPPALGAVGAGTGAVAGGLQGGVGTASVSVDGLVVGALAVVNASGSAIDLATGLPWCADGLGLSRPSAADRRTLRAHAAEREARVLNTTIGVVATSAALTPAEATKLAGVAHDGLARAVRPAHSMFDGDTVFALATGASELDPAPPDGAGFRVADSRPGRLNRILEAGAQVFATACAEAVVRAAAHSSGPSPPPAYRDLAPSAFR